MIRKMRPEDRETFCAFADDFYHSGAALHAVPKANFDHTFDTVLSGSPHVIGLMLEDGGRAAGYSLLQPVYSNEMDGIVLWIDELYVRPECRGRGLARELLRNVCSAYHGKVSALRLEVTHTNRRAVSLYRSEGFGDLGYAQMLKPLEQDDSAERQEGKKK